MKNKVRDLRGKPHTNYKDKKLQSLRSLIYNPLFEISVQIFTWLLYLKDLFSNTYTLIHILDATTLIL